jgi:molybdopterin converting factor small subunit
MKIKVKVIGPLIYEAGFSEKEFEMPPGTTAGGMLELIGIPKERSKIMTRNGSAVALQDLLADGDRIAISPVYSGG